MWHWFACAMEMGWGGWTGREDEHCRLVEPWDNCCWGSRQCTALRLLVSEARAGRESRSLCGNGGKEVLGERGWEGFGAPGRHAGRLCGTGFGGAERRVRLSQDKLLTGAAQSTQKRGFGDEGNWMRAMIRSSSASLDETAPLDRTEPNSHLHTHAQASLFVLDVSAAAAAAAVSSSSSSSSSSSNRRRQTRLLGQPEGVQAASIDQAPTTHHHHTTKGPSITPAPPIMSRTRFTLEDTERGRKLHAAFKAFLGGDLWCPCLH